MFLPLLLPLVVCVAFCTLLFKSQQNDKASEEHLLVAIAKDTTHPQARAALGQLHENRGDHQQALANYHMALQRNSAQPQLHAKVASLKGGTTGSPLLTPAPLTKVVTAPSNNLRY